VVFLNYEEDAMKKTNMKLLLVLLLVLASAAVAFADHQKAIYLPTAPFPGSYSSGIKYGNLVFVSGQICNPATDGEGCNNIGQATDVVMLKVLDILKEANMDFDNVLMTTVYLKSSSTDDFNTFNTFYLNYFTSDYRPARASIQGVIIPKGSLLEISVIAGK
jgi:2-iminobutanoate/2-iminopropanoate deaminase